MEQLQSLINTTNNFAYASALDTYISRRTWDELLQDMEYLHRDPYTAYEGVNKAELEEFFRDAMDTARDEGTTLRRLYTPSENSSTDGVCPDFSAVRNDDPEPVKVEEVQPEPVSTKVEEPSAPIVEEVVTEVPAEPTIEEFVKEVQPEPIVHRSLIGKAWEDIDLDVYALNLMVSISEHKTQVKGAEKSRNTYELGVVLDRKRKELPADQDFGKWRSQKKKLFLDRGMKEITDQSLLNFTKLPNYGSLDDCLELGFSNVYKVIDKKVDPASVKEWLATAPNGTDKDGNPKKPTTKQVNEFCDRKAVSAPTLSKAELQLKNLLQTILVLAGIPTTGVVAEVFNTTVNTKYSSMVEAGQDTSEIQHWVDTLQEHKENLKKFGLLID